MTKNLAELTSIKIGGAADFFYEPATVAELTALLAAHPDAVLLGGGTNIVFGAMPRRAVISMKKINAALNEWREIAADEIRVTVGAGKPLAEVVRQAVAGGWRGVENLIGIPGTVGGAVAMNAGAQGRAIGDAVEKVVGVDYGGTPVEKIFTPAELGFAYRTSRLQTAPIAVVAVELRLRRTAVAELAPRAAAWLAARAACRIKLPNCGSVFRNPAGEKSAGELLESAGMKGETRGALRVSPTHANFFENLGGATGDDFCDLLDRARDAVRRRTGIALTPEVKIIGEFCRKN
ncbi:UDP-N-acetylenolpyruvoylglucosamine reductase [Planctomycetales bacterium]|nr:UDP-N-acetylenolpyruvoylglucosamine reductase [Planctomycetales bacterium]GHT06300.1 UDP-N-acetylenolpyruvoylglucosamine reductase [Planctomycetales bacterium]